MRSLVPLGILLAASVARADVRAKLGTHLALVVEPTTHELFVEDGTVRAPLLDDISDLQSASVDPTTQTVKIELQTARCMVSYDTSFSLAHLQARLANVRGYARYQKHDYRAALPYYRAAITSDATWRIPALNLASAENLLGDQDAAVAALDPWLASDPIGTYVAVARDPELSSLLARKELAALEVRQRATIHIDASIDAPPFVALSARHGAIAFVRLDHSWGADDVYEAFLEIDDVGTAKQLVSLPLVAYGESKATIAHHVAEAETLLAALGFRAVKPEHPIDRTTDDTKRKLTFPKARIGVVLANGKLHALRGNKTLLETPCWAHVDEIGYVADAKLLVVWSHTPGAEGCMAFDPSDITFYALQ